MGQAATKTSGRHDDNDSDSISSYEALCLKQRAIEGENARLPSTLQVPAPFKVQRVSKVRACDASVSLDDNIRQAVHDFVSTVHGTNCYPDEDVSADSLNASLQPEVSTLLQGARSTTPHSSDSTTTYVQHAWSLPMFAQAALMVVDVIVGVMVDITRTHIHIHSHKHPCAFYVADVSFIHISSLCFQEICHLADTALCMRKFARSHVPVAKELHRLALMEAQFTTATSAPLRCSYRGDIFTRCVSCQLTLTRVKINKEYDKINGCGAELGAGDSDTEDEN